MAALLGAMVDLGYGVAYRVLDARYFGVPQRRRRVFIVGVRSDPDDPDGRAAALRAAEVLAVGTRCGWHPASGHQPGKDAAEGAGGRVAPPVRSGDHGDPGIGRDNDHDRLVYNATPAFGAWTGPDAEAGNLSQRDYKSSNHLLVDGSPPDPDRVRAPDGLAGRLDGGDGVAWNPYRTLGRDGSITSGYAPRPVVDALHGPTGNKEPLVISASAGHHGNSSPRGDGGDNLVVHGLSTQHGVTEDGTGRGVPIVVGASGMTDDALLPPGLDSHRYRCCGNGVVSSVAEWIGLRLAGYVGDRLMEGERWTEPRQEP